MPGGPLKKSVTDLVAEAFDATWAPEERRQLDTDAGQPVHPSGDRSGAYVAHTIVSKTQIAAAGGATSPTSRQDVTVGGGGGGVGDADHEDDSADASALLGTGRADAALASSSRGGEGMGDHEHEANNGGNDDAVASDGAGDEADDAGTGSGAESAPASPTAAMTDGAKLQQLNQKAEELDRISRMIADKITTSLSVSATTSRPGAGLGRPGGGPHHVGPHARGLLQKTSPKRRPAREGAAAAAAANGLRGGRGAKTAGKGKKKKKIASRFNSNPLAGSGGPRARRRQQQQLRPLRRRKKLWEAKSPAGRPWSGAAAGGGAGDSGFESDDGGEGGTGSGEMRAAMPFATTSSVISRGPGRRSRKEVVQAVRDGKERLKQQKLGHQPWSRVEAEAKELLANAKREEEAKKEAKRQAAGIAMARLKTISVGQWLQTLRMEHVYEAFLEEGYETVHDLLELTEGEFHMLLKEVGVRKLKRRAEMHRKLRAFLNAVLESAAATHTKAANKRGVAAVATARDSGEGGGSGGSDDEDTGFGGGGGGSESDDGGGGGGSSLPAIGGPRRSAARSRGGAGSRDDSLVAAGGGDNDSDGRLPDIRAMSAIGSAKE